MVKTCFTICGLTLALDGIEDGAWCSHNFGEGYRELLQHQRVEWEAAHPGATLPPLELPVLSEGDAGGTKPTAVLEKKLEKAKLLPTGGGGGATAT